MYVRSYSISLTESFVSCNTVTLRLNLKTPSNHRCTDPIMLSEQISLFLCRLAAAQLILQLLDIVLNEFPGVRSASACTNMVSN